MSEKFQIKIKDKFLSDVLDPFDIDAISLATKREKFTKDDMIVKEIEKGKTLCMVEDSVVHVLKKECRGMPKVSLGVGSFFGEKASFSDNVE